MTIANEPAERPVVTELRRPPVRQSILVRASAQHTFTTFVTTIGVWWPVQPFSAGKDRVRDISVEHRQGGRVYEIWDDPTEVEFSFAVLGPALTRVTVEHRGWEALTDEQLAEDCALPGGYHSGAYSRGSTRYCSGVSSWRHCSSGLVTSRMVVASMLRSLGGVAQVTAEDHHGGRFGGQNPACE